MSLSWGERICTNVPSQRSFSLIFSGFWSRFEESFRNCRLIALAFRWKAILQLTNELNEWVVDLPFLTTLAMQRLNLRDDFSQPIEPDFPWVALLGS
jgi:hypothetical protein